MSDTSTLDRLYLEWSNFTKAKTAKDLANKRRIDDLKRQLAEAQEALRNLYALVKGECPRLLSDEDKLVISIAAAIAPPTSPSE